MVQFAASLILDGYDELTGTTAAETIAGTANADLIQGGAGNDVIFGLYGNDTLNGDAGSDTIFGGSGADTLTGGADTDYFTYSLATHSAVSSGDTITDFDAAGDPLSSGDKIKITDILTGTFSFLGANTVSFTGATGGNNTEARFNDTTKLLEIDANGDATVDMEITLSAVSISNLDATDFTVI
jgi:Ca2+-binding RTX toxin-like protein